MRLAVFISGRGSNMLALARAVDEGNLHAEIVTVYSDKRNAIGLQKAKELGLKTQSLNWEESSITHCIESLKAQKIDYVVLAGFMRVLPASFVQSFPQKIVNIHPSLLPAHKGMKAIEKAYHAQDKEMGISIHYVDEGVDTGPVIAQFKIDRTEHETLEEVEEKIHALEHKQYWRTLQKLINEQNV